MSWISGPCDDDEPPPVVVVFEDRPEGSDRPEVEVDEETGVIWIDSGSGPGFLRHVTGHQRGEMPSDRD